MKKADRHSLGRRLWSVLVGLTAFALLASTLIFLHASTFQRLAQDAQSDSALAGSLQNDVLENETPDGRPDYSSPAALAISISWPLYDGGSRADPRSLTGVRRNDFDSGAVLEAYRDARALAASRQTWEGSPKGLLSPTKYFGNCSAFVATVVIDTITPRFPQGTALMYPWMTDRANGWILVGDTEHYQPSSYQPGDIFLTRGTGHTFIWIGEHAGVSDVIADAALGNEQGTTTRVGTLRQSPIDPKTGTDKTGRVYDVWRYQGTEQRA